LRKAFLTDHSLVRKKQTTNNPHNLPADKGGGGMKHSHSYTSFDMIKSVDGTQTINTGIDTGKVGNTTRGDRKGRSGGQQQNRRRTTTNERWEIPTLIAPSSNPRSTSNNNKTSVGPNRRHTADGIQQQQQSKNNNNMRGERG